MGIARPTFYDEPTAADDDTASARHRADKTAAKQGLPIAPFMQTC
jgi:hypothetical protein